MTFRDLKLRLRALVAPRRVERELDEELAFHLAREEAKLVDAGVPTVEARQRARARFGSVPQIADECRDARGITFLDTLRRDLAYALRAFGRAPLPALTIVGTISLGLGMLAVAFSFYNALVLRTDAVRNPEELFEVRRPPSPGDGVWMAFTPPQFEALRRDTQAFSGVTAVVQSVDGRIEGLPVSGSLVTDGFFDVLGAAATMGRTLTQGERDPVLVLSHRGWTRIFDADPAVVGRTVQLNGRPFGVLGVMPPDFRGLELIPPDYWAPLARLADFRPADRGKELTVELPTVIGRLRSGVSVEAATAQLTAWAAGNDDLPAWSGRPKTIQLIPQDATVFSALDGLVSFAPLFFAFGLVLLIGCANVANLLLARGLARQREIAIRLSLGASRTRIVRQLITESLLPALIAAAGGLLVSQLFLEGAVRAAIATVPPDTAELLRLAVLPADWRVIAFLLAAAVASTMVFAVVPALRATRVEPVRTLRGEVIRAARPGFARHVLVTVQVGASALLLVTAAVFLRGALTAALADPGIRVAQIAFVDTVSEPVRVPVLQATASDPVVASIAAIYPQGIAGLNADATVVEETSGSGRSDAVSFKLVSPEYFDVIGLDVLRGRGFAPDERSASAGVVVVSERAVRELWPDRDAIGQRLRLAPWAYRPPHARNGPDPTPADATYTVIGVIPSVRVGIGDGRMFSAWIYLPTDAAQPGTSLALRVRGDSEQAVRQLSDRLTQVDPGLGAIWALETRAARGESILHMGFQVTAWLGALALLLTVSGVFGVLSYLVEQRRREIGVRMALGARPGNVVRLVLLQSLRPVVVGLLAGVGLAGVLASALLALPGAFNVGRDVRIYDPTTYAIGIACIAIPCVLAACLPALRASRIDPMATLRAE